MRRSTVGHGAKDNTLLPVTRMQASGSLCGRNGGLFSSSSSSSENSDASDEEISKSQRSGAVPPLLGVMVRSRLVNTHSSAPVAADVRRRNVFSTSSTSLGSSSGVGGTGRHVVGRKGLFEKDDDVGDSLATLQERVKLRQSEKQSEMKVLRAQLETAEQRVNEMETRLRESNQFKEEFSIRTKECQRIIEKRNKQLMKASEKMARYSEQYKLQTAELQTRLKYVNAQCDHVRAEVVTMKERGMIEWELKKKGVRKEMEMWSKKYEKALHAAEARYREQEEKNAVLAKRLRELEQQLTTVRNRKPTAPQVMASKEYQSLKKRCDDTEAISRGLQFQLEKEQQEKRHIFEQLTAFQKTSGAKTAVATAASVASSLEQKDDPGKYEDNIKCVLTETDLASVDSAAGNRSNTSSPRRTTVSVSAVVGSPTSAASSPSQNRLRGLSASSFTDDVPKPSLREGRRRAASAKAIQTVREPPAEDNVGNGKSIAASVTFFGKLSSRFKRGSSPGRSLNIKSVADDDKDEVKTVDEIGLATSHLSHRGLVYNKVLKDRPRMYVARSSFDQEDESSDSIFGSESSLSDVTDVDTPPPPPPIVVHEASPPFIPPVHVDVSSQRVSLDISADADSSSSSSPSSPSSSSSTSIEILERQKWRKAADSPIELSNIAHTLETDGQTDNLSTSKPPVKAALPLSSSSSSSDDDFDEPDVEESQPIHADINKSESLSESSLSMSSSSSEDTGQVLHARKMKVKRKVEKDSRSDEDKNGKPSSRSPTSSKSQEEDRGLNRGNKPHKTSKIRMNEYMEARAKKRNEKVMRTQQKEHEKTIKQEEYEKEWEKMAQEERERKRKQQQARRNGRRRPVSMKTVRVSQMRHQMINKLQQKDQKEASVPLPFHPNDLSRSHGDDGMDDGHRSRRKSESKTSGSEAEEERPSVFRSPSTDSPPLPPEPTVADTELYLRQQARLRERHELQMKKKVEADEADAVRGDIHRRVEMWAFGKEILHMILTLDQISSNSALKKCQLMVVQSPDDDTVRKAYRNIIRVVHPDKLRGATIPEQMEAKELFTVLNQAFEKFKHQVS